MFDSKVLDDSFYRAREISYFLDFIDFKFIEFSIENGFPHFLSLTHYVLSMTIGCLLWLFFVKKLNLSPLMGIGLLSLFWTTPSVFYGNVNRTGKIWVAFLETILFYLIYKVSISITKKIDSRFTAKFWVMCFVIVFAMTSLDEQGLFLAMALLISILIWSFYIRHRNIYIMLFVVAASLIVNGFCRYLIIPYFTCKLNGYWPVTFFWELPVKYFIQNLGTYLSGGFFLYADTFRFLIGYPPRVVGIGFLLFFVSIPLFYLYTGKRIATDYRKSLILIYVELLTINILLIIMNSLMVLRIPSLNARQFFWLPTTVILMMSLAIFIYIFNRLNVPRWLVSLVMFLCVVGNISVLTQSEAFNMKNNLTSESRQNLILLNALKNPDLANFAENPLLKKNPVFQFFKSKENSNAVAKSKILELAEGKGHCVKPNDADAYNEKGIFYANVGEYPQAIEDFNKAIRLTPNHIHALNNRGLAYARLGKFQLAIEDINNVIRMEPSFTSAYINRGIVYLTQGNKELGCRDAQRACELGNCRLIEMAKSNKYCP
jgi:Flp pilus assembly protein TadD